MGIVNPSGGGGGSWYPTTVPVVGTVSGSGVLVQPPVGVTWIIPTRLWAATWLLKDTVGGQTWTLTAKTSLSAGPFVVVTSRFVLQTLGVGNYAYSGWLAI